MWTALLEGMLRRVIREGDLRICTGDGRQMRFGDGSEPRVVVHLKDRATLLRLLIDPELALGEAYMDHALSIEGDDVQGLMTLVLRNVTDSAQVSLPARVLAAFRQLRRGIDQANSASAARSNVAHHYDLTPAIYDLFLDADRQYSCAYFPQANLSLDAAQQAKTAHIARKLLLEPGMRVLDIGCGWGGLALGLARDHGVEVFGITLSREQLEGARERARKEGLADRVAFGLADYRSLRGTFDRIVSVGMFEHVGAPNFRTFFDILRARLAEDGVALVHTIGRTAPPAATNPWIARHIFPGGYVPSLSEISAAVEGSGLRIGDIECLRLHYAMTLHCWFERFSARSATATALMDERFVRMWRYYLAAAEQTFRQAPQDVFQFQLCRRADAVPITRDYLYTPAGPGTARPADRSQGHVVVMSRQGAAAPREPSQKRGDPLDLGGLDLPGPRKESPLDLQHLDQALAPREIAAKQPVLLEPCPEDARRLEAQLERGLKGEGPEREGRGRSGEGGGHRSGLRKMDVQPDPAGERHH